MGLLGTIGRGLLRAAPYVAAPFTGGASLYAAPLANNLADRFAGSNPGRADRVMSAAGNAAAMAGGMGAFGGGRFSAGNFGGGQDQGIGPSQGILGRILGGGQNPYRTPDFNPYGGGQQGGGLDFGSIMARIPGLMSRGTGGQSMPRPQEPQRGIGPNQGGQAMPRGGGGYGGGYNPYETSPNLGYAIEAGRSDAMRNQPWRQAPIEADPLNQLPNIYPQFNPNQYARMQ